MFLENNNNNLNETTVNNLHSQVAKLSPEMQDIFYRYNSKLLNLGVFLNERDSLIKNTKTAPAR